MTAKGATIMNGLLLVDKPAGVTSHDVVARVRRAARTRRVGHAGTLDPFATGLLVLAVGPSTRLLPYVHGEPKVYHTTIRFGAETDTDDVTGTVTHTIPLTDWQRLEPSIAALTGTFPQTPPSYSAKHVHGERAYALARRGESVALPSVLVTVHGWQWRAVAGDVVDATITCSGGTYVRALARDLGRAANSGAYCLALRRLASGACHVRDAVAFDDLSPGSIADGVILLQRPLPFLLPMAVEVLNSATLEQLRHGRTIPSSHEGLSAVLVDADSNVLAIAVRDAGGAWQPRVVLSGTDSE